jgi:hypothetical protein
MPCGNTLTVLFRLRLESFGWRGDCKKVVVRLKVECLQFAEKACLVIVGVLLGLLLLGLGLRSVGLVRLFWLKSKL